TFLNENTYSLEVEFVNNTASVQNYLTKDISSVSVPVGLFKREFKIGELVILPFLKGTVVLAENSTPNIGEPLYLQIVNFDGIVSSYQGRLSVPNTSSSPILDITLSDKNTAKRLDYLNAHVAVLSEDQLKRKHQYASNAINFIDS